jgi:HD-GYP domain-containing protein (c-di-GMP phosphodiesterase class II)
MGDHGASDRRQQEPRWAARPRGAQAVRAAVFLVPVVAATGAGWLVARSVPTPSSLLGHAGLWAAVLLVSLLALVLADRAIRRILPLAVLLDLALVFPDRAPSRLRVAREAVRRRTVEEHLARLASAGQDPARAAEVVLGLVAALDGHDRATRGHAERVRLFTDLIAEEMRLPDSDRDRLRWASLLHDIGKLAVPSSLLNKPGKPDSTEWELLRSHPEVGARLAAPLLPWLGEWGHLIAQHHERWDGTGYPLGLSGREICRGGRIVAVADAFDVMTAARAYRRPVSRAAAFRELVRCSGTQFDPEAVRALVGISVPRLRRAQGALAFLADVPLLAARTVPAQTLVQAIGAGALVAGGPALGGIGGPVVPGAAAPATETAGTVADPVAGRVAGGRTAATGAAAAGGAVPAAESPVAAAGPRDTAPSDPRSDPRSDAAAPADTGSVGPAPAPPQPAPAQPAPSRQRQPASSAGDVVGGSVAAAGGAVGGAVGAVGGTVDTVGGTVGGTVGAVGGAVGDAVGGPVGGTVGSVSGAVGDATSGVGGAVGDAVGAVGEVVSGTTGDLGSVVGGLLGRRR